MLIINADDRAGAEQLRDLVLQRNPAFSVRIENIGPVIGAHCGPGTLAVCFLGKKERKL